MAIRLFAKKGNFIEATLVGEDQPESSWLAQGLALSVLGAMAFCLRSSAFASVAPMLTDEAFSWVLAGQNELTETIRMTAEDVHPPLYYVILWGWVRLFGDSLFAMRSLSSLFGVSTVWATFFYATIWHGRHPNPIVHREMPLFSAFLVAISVSQVAVSQWARMYTLLGLLAVLASVLLLLAVENPRRRCYWVGYSLTATAALYTHNYAILFLAAQGIWVSVEAIVGPSRERWRQTLAGYAVSLFAISLLYSPWVPYLLWQTQQVSADYWIQPLQFSDLSDLLLLLLGAPLLDDHAVPWIANCFFILVTVALIIPWRSRPAERQLTVLVLTHVLLLILASVILGRSVYVPRYIVHLGPLLIVPLSFWVASISDAYIRWLGMASLCVLIGAVLILLVSEYSPLLKDSSTTRLRQSLVAAEQEGVIIVDGAPAYMLIRYEASQAGLRSPIFVADRDLEQLSGEQHVVFASAISKREIWSDMQNESQHSYASVFSPNNAPPALATDWNRISTEIVRKDIPGCQTPFYLFKYEIPPPKSEW